MIHVEMYKFVIFIPFLKCYSLFLLINLLPKFVVKRSTDINCKMNYVGRFVLTFLV